MPVNVDKLKEQGFQSSLLTEHWGTGKPLEYKGKQWRVGKMSYGKYYLEPYNPKYPLGIGETQPFPPDTIWLEKKFIKSKQGENKEIYIEE